MVKDTKELDMIALELVALNEQLTFLQEQINDSKVNFEKVMSDMNIAKYNKNGLKVSKTCETIRESFNSKKLKEDNPDMYEKYIKKSKVKGGYRYKYE